MVTRAFVLVLGGVLGLVGCGDDATSGERLRILVTNDDGVAAHGIDAVVEALVADPSNDVVVCAPESNRSGSSDMTGPSAFCGDLSVSSTTTLSGFDATAINGCPADAVNYALDNLYPADAPPHVVISGLNEGQNVSAVIASLSGTVGAAKTAARRGVPALASSQGIPGDGGEFDYPAGAEAVLAWLGPRRADLAQGALPPEADSINIPSCGSGAIRGTVVVPLAPTVEGAVEPQNCSSSLQDPANDVQALNNGFIAQTDIPLD